MRIGIVGCGPAGILVFLELLHQGIPAKEILIVDPYFDGGSLLRKWGAIHSNTRWEQVRDAIIEYPSAKQPIETLNQIYSPEQTVLLSDLGTCLFQTIQPYFSELQTILTQCTGISYDSAKPVLHTKDQKIPCDFVFLCQGGLQKAVECGKPTIPLEVALDPALLKRYVKPGQTVSVFGMAHSGTIVLKHLLECNANPIGFYKTTSPFLFARDGNYDGIKQESAEIADKILSANPPLVQLYPSQNLKYVIQSITKSDWVISCTGFEASPIQIKDESGIVIDSCQYSSQTGQVAKCIYGFGLAYPGVSEVEGKAFKDISIPSFIHQIKRCLPEILKNNQS